MVEAARSEPQQPLNLEWSGMPTQEPMGTPAAYSPDSDVIDRGVISLELATQLLHSYNTGLVNYFPTVHFPPEVTVEELRNTKPTLFLAAIAAASGKEGSRLYSILNTEVLSAYAHLTVIRGEKSLELVQALIITSVWYYPPGKYSQLKFYEYIHMAATMALDIGLGTNPKTFRSRRGTDSDGDSPPAGDLNDAELEKRKTFLACYLISTGVAMSMRRPNMLRFNKWINECLESVANNPRATKLDTYLVHWVRVTKIQDELGQSLSFDDPSNMANLAEPMVQLKVTGFEKTLEAWKKVAEFEVNDILMLQYHHTQMYLHEIAMHDEHPPEDFMPPFGLEKILSVLTIQSDSRAPSSYIDSTAVSISSAQAFLDILINMDIDALRMIPIFNFARMAYCLITLIKLYISAKTPSSPIGSVLDPKSLKIGYYLNALMETLVEAIGPNECRSPYTFLGMILRFQAWYNSQEHTDVFVPPIANRRAEDCWLPPVPEIHWYRRLEKRQETLDRPPIGRTPSDGTMMPNEMLQDPFERMDLNVNRAKNIGSGATGSGGGPTDPGNEQSIENFLLYDQMEGLGQGFGEWMPEVDMPGNQMDGYSWEFSQGTGHTPPQ